MRTTILNDSYLFECPKPAESTFSMFSKLPQEIALTIWKLVLRLQRIIGITVKARVVYPEYHFLHRMPYSTKNRLGNIVSNQGYSLSITTDHRLTPLLQVNRQSRQAALEFYRVHIPYYQDNLDHKPQQHLYLNPEFDVLHIKAYGTRDDFTDVIVDFLHDAKAYDVQGHGIRNLAIGHSVQPELIVPMSMDHKG